MSPIHTHDPQPAPGPMATGPGRRPPLRVAILADATRVPRYAVDTLRTALGAPDIELVGIYRLSPRPVPVSARHLFDALDAVETLLYRLFGRPTADFDKIDMATALATRMLGQLAADRLGGRLAPDENALEHLRDQKLDVLLCWTQAPLAVPPGIVRHGVLGMEIGYGAPAGASWAGAAELAQGSPVMVTRVVDYAAPDAAELFVACVATAPTSLRRNRRNALAKGAAVLRRLLQSLGTAAMGVEGVDGGRAVPRLLDLPAGYPHAPRPSPGLFARACRQVGRRLLHNRLDKKADYNLWHLAYVFSDRDLPEIAFERLRYLAPAPGTFWADPFPLLHEGRHYILFEELPYASLRGRLLAVEVAEAGPARAPVPVLERNYHLSYPQVFHWEGELYMVPETKHARRIQLLRCVRFPSQWELHSVILDDVRAVDATLRHQDGSWWMFVNLALEGLEAADELHLYYADSLFGEWLPHPANPVCADVRCARPAGPLFEAGGELFRPSQDCATKYGGALWINRIERLDRSGFRERPVRRIAPDWHPDISTVHTLGRAGRLTVLDCVVDDRGGLDIQRTY